MACRGFSQCFFLSLSVFATAQISFEYANRSYAPWCGHCKTLAGAYKKLGKAVSEDPFLSSRVAVAKVNADEHRVLAERFKVSGYPTIKFFPRGFPAGQNVEDYPEARSLDAMLGFLKEKAENDQTYGRVDALDSFAREFVSDSSDKVSDKALSE